MIICEGLDNTGKTTLVLRMADDLKLLHIANKRKPKSKSDFFTYFSSVLNLAKQFPVILDRWAPISEQVYGPTIRGNMIFTEHDLDVAKQAPLIAGIKPLLIYCRPKDETILDFGERSQMRGVVEHAQHLLRTYDSIIDSFRIQYHVVCYDFERPGAYDYIRQRAIEHLQEYYPCQTAAFADAI